MRPNWSRRLPARQWLLVSLALFVAVVIFATAEGVASQRRLDAVVAMRAQASPEAVRAAYREQRQADDRAMLAAVAVLGLAVASGWAASCARDRELRAAAAMPVRLRTPDASTLPPAAADDAPLPASRAA